ncbi:hypothetical protein N8K70_03770 [Microbacterium betulae]|uniref:Uncharacterized protein n=1 Tax=Microbacterium betulae TaxID=2981139 RepID=A0AA97FJC1_9MICO|nr:hypothetical protein [Microbacterium sp. AB]WOF23808.1 hypothetical protein N8K70_03770 [Microbacterium sp. AB]
MSQQVIDFLNDLPDASEGHEVSEFGVYFDNQEVTVRVIDRGADSGHIRYTVEAWLSASTHLPPWERGNGYSSGNAAPTLELALHEVHWNAIRNEALKDD